MDLYIVRHGEAGERDPDRWPDDARRPLTDEGVRRFREACVGLRRLASEVDLVLASPAERAWRTAVLLHEVAGWPAPRALESLWEASQPPALLAAMEEVRSGAESVALVGHEPLLSALATYLVAGERDDAVLDLKKGGALRISAAARPQSGTGALRWLVTQKALRAMH